MEGHATKCDVAQDNCENSKHNLPRPSHTDPATPNRNNAHGTTTTIAETSDAAQSQPVVDTRLVHRHVGPRHKDGVTGTSPNNKTHRYVCVRVCGGVWCVVLGPSAHVAGARAKRGDVCDSRQRHPRRMRGAPAVCFAADQQTVRGDVPRHPSLYK